MVIQSFPGETEPRSRVWTSRLVSAGADHVTLSDLSPYQTALTALGGGRVPVVVAVVVAVWLR